MIRDVPECSIFLVLSTVSETVICSITSRAKLRELFHCEHWINVYSIISHEDRIIPNTILNFDTLLESILFVTAANHDQQ